VQKDKTGFFPIKQKKVWFLFWDIKKCQPNFLDFYIHKMKYALKKLTFQLTNQPLNWNEPYCCLDSLLLIQLTHTY